MGERMGGSTGSRVAEAGGGHGGGGIAVEEIALPEVILPDGREFLSLDLGATLGSGQVFHWFPRRAGHVGLIGEVPVYLEQRGARKLAVSAGCAGLAWRYLGMEDALGEILGSFPRPDAALDSALGYCPGIRILRQPAWECLATFITSSLKQVPHIRKMSLTLRRRFGRAVNYAGVELFAYPEPEVLAGVGEEALRECGLGYRAKYLLGAARDVAEGRCDLAAVAALGDAEARAALCGLYGVGEKIADCTLLFGFGRLAAFPVDVWVERTLKDLYFPKRRGKLAPTVRALREFARERFGAFGGYAQQYLFHRARMGG